MPKFRVDTGQTSHLDLPALHTSREISDLDQRTSQITQFGAIPTPDPVFKKSLKLTPSRGRIVPFVQKRQQEGLRVRSTVRSTLRTVHARDMLQPPGSWTSESWLFTTTSPPRSWRPRLRCHIANGLDRTALHTETCIAYALCTRPEGKHLVFIGVPRRSPPSTPPDQAEPANRPLLQKYEGHSIGSCAAH